MEVILLDVVRNLGHIGDKVKVKPGYGRNYLIPQGKAAAATAANIAAFEAHRAELEKAAAAALAKARQRADKLNGMHFKVPAKVGEEGKLFGSVGTREIIKAIHDAGQEVEKSEIILPEGAIRQVGEYNVELQLHSELSATVVIEIVPEE